MLVLSACDDRDYQFCALYPPSREYQPEVLVEDGQISFAWEGGPVHELHVGGQGDSIWNTDCQREDEDGLLAPCLESPTVLPAQRAERLEPGAKYTMSVVLRCAMGGDEIEHRTRYQSFRAPEL
jgi:hypothetical protein